MVSENHRKQILHQFGLKVTETRLKVLEVLMNSPVALSHSDITGQISDMVLDKVTLYRTLNAFTERGLTHKVATEDRNWRYALHMHDSNDAAKGDDHAHFVCEECERIYCLPMEMKPSAPVRSEKGGFIITSHEYRLHGICPECN